MNADRLQSALRVLLLALASGIVLIGFLSSVEGAHVGINEYPRARFVEMVEGEAHTPYVRRALLPTLVRLARAAAPAPLEAACRELAGESGPLAAAFAEFRWESDEAFAFLVGALLMWLCFAGFAPACVRLIETAFDRAFAPWSRLGLTLLALAGLPPMFRYTSYPYDPPQLFLFALALGFAAARRLRPFVAVFVLCCLNKETALLLVPVAAIAWRHQLPTPARYRSLLFALGAIYLVITAALAWHFRGNPGGLVELHLGHTLRTLAAGYSLAALLAALALAALLSYRWREQPAFLRQAWLAVLLPLLGLGLVLGYIDEWRAYYEAYPLTFALLVGAGDRLGLRLGWPPLLR